MNEQKIENSEDVDSRRSLPRTEPTPHHDAEMRDGNDRFKRIKKILIVLGIILIVFIGVEFISAAKYKTMVVVTDKQGVVGINPLTESLDFGELSKGSSISRFITLKSQGKISTFVIVVITGGIKDLIEVDKNYFTLSGGEEQKIDFHLDIPISADKEKYKGRVFIFRLPKI